MAADLLEQPVLGSRRLSNILVALMVTLAVLVFFSLLSPVTWAGIFFP